MNVFPALRRLSLALLLPVGASIAATNPSGSELVELVSGLAIQDDSRTFNVSNFDRLDLGSAFIINVSRGSGYKVTAAGRREDLNDLEANVSGGNLQVRYKDRMGNRNRQRVTVTITMPTLKAISFSGASKSTVTGFTGLKDLGIDISGASTAEIDVDAERVMTDLSGASSVTLNGRTKRLEGDVSGATSLRAYDLKVANATVEVSGASNAQLNVSDRLDAQASGASSVRYRGGASLKANTSGASSIRSSDR